MAVYILYAVVPTDDEYIFIEDAGAPLKPTRAQRRSKAERVKEKRYLERAKEASQRDKGIDSGPRGFGMDDIQSQ
jgi:hypothetical protein